MRVSASRFDLEQPLNIELFEEERPFFGSSQATPCRMVEDTLIKLGLVQEV